MERDQLDEEAPEGVLGAVFGQAVPSSPDYRFKQLRHGDVDECLLAAEASHDGGRADGGLGRDRLDGEVGARVGEQRSCRLEYALPVADGVCPASWGTPRGGA